MLNSIAYKQRTTFDKSNEASNLIFFEVKPLRLVHNTLTPQYPQPPKAFISSKMICGLSNSQILTHALVPQTIDLSTAILEGSNLRASIIQLTTLQFFLLKDFP